MVGAVGGLSAPTYRLSSQYRDQPGGRMMCLVRRGAGARPGLRLDSRQPSTTETSHEMSRPNRRRRDEETGGVVGLPVLEHGVHRMKQLDGDNDQRLLGRFALGLRAEINGARLATTGPGLDGGA